MCQQARKKPRKSKGAKNGAGTARRRISARVLVRTLGFLGLLAAVCRISASVVVDRLMIDTDGASKNTINR
jgi:hypothetical protein